MLFLVTLIEKKDGSENNPGNSSTTKIGKHIPCGYLMSTICAFNNIESKHTLHRGEDCIKHFCESLRKHAKNIIVKKVLPLTKEELISYQDAKIC